MIYVNMFIHAQFLSFGCFESTFWANGDKSHDLNGTSPVDRGYCCDRAYSVGVWKGIVLVYGAVWDQ